MHDETVARNWLDDTVVRSFDWPSAALVLCGAYLLYILIYGLFLCPTRHIPGPFFTRFTSIYPIYLQFCGTGLEQARRLHERTVILRSMSLLTSRPRRPPQPKGPPNHTPRSCIHGMGNSNPRQKTLEERSYPLSGCKRLEMGLSSF
jgi:hypothetical protein